MVQLIPMSPEYLPVVLSLEVAGEQLPYVGTAEQILLNASETVHPHLVLANEVVIGMFLVDSAYGNEYDFAPPSALGFRGFLIDIKSQGLGYGSQVIALLPQYLALKYPNFRSVYLTVNCKNRAAYRCYLNNGFHDEGELFMGGSAGPQHILLMNM